ncbi:Arylsulfatase A or related enzyme [Proteiniphilum saccharofermentans]|uniref:Arylsulfatase A or related enzyme n=1 Tax=Proteiniphilum saccharofermentans TaxID=1642647 RepID=A0A1R3T980_9BACT|nr:sulfatase [Proteiniphilum saccharofermentans]SCD21858.1 Arylsulfatase A or related enzyme [Proteiniphilum saccharofermentans]
MVAFLESNMLKKGKIWAYLIGSICFSQNIWGQKPSASPPNILVFIADDAGMDFGCYGNPAIKTPNIDRLATKGIRFKNAYVTSPQSSPSRTSMMTGMFAHTIGTEDLHTPLKEGIKIIPFYFSEAGYYTGSMLKTHWGLEGDKQFDRVIPGGYLPNQGNLTEESYKNYIDFLHACENNPFFLWVGFVDPHRPYNRNVCPQKNNPDKVKVPPYLVDGPDTRRDLTDYYDEITRMDENIGRMLSILDEKGKLDNTIVVFLSDNGMPFPRSKGSLYDSGIQTPLIFMWEGKINPGTVHENGLITTVDLAPTLLSLAGIPTPQSIYGESFHKVVLDHTGRGRNFIFAERNWHDTDEYIRCIRSEKYKLIYNAYYEFPHGTAADLSSSMSWYELKKQQRKGLLTKEQLQIFTAPRPMVELYDLENDPFELNNIADLQEYVQEGRKLAKLLTQWQEETHDHPSWKHKRADKNDRITGFLLFDEIPELRDE